MIKLSEIAEIPPTTAKQRKFVHELIQTLSPTEAAMRAFDCKDRISAKNVGCIYMKKLRITLENLLDLSGLDIKKDIEDLKRLRSAKFTKFFDYKGEITDQVDLDDNQTQLKALELTLKMKGVLKEYNNDVDTQPQKIVVQIVNTNGVNNGNGKPDVTTESITSISEKL